MNTFVLISKDGTRKEVPFLLGESKPRISKHIYAAEFGEHNRTGEWIPEVQFYAFEPLLQLFEKVREIVRRPVPVNSGYRSLLKQQQLYDADIRANNGKPSGKVSKPGNSPHVTGAAMDLGIPAGWSAQNLAALFRKASVEMGLPMCRVGWKNYGGAFIHVDLVFMLYKPYTEVTNPVPGAWSPGVVW